MTISPPDAPQADAPVVAAACAEGVAPALAVIEASTRRYDADAVVVSLAQLPLRERVAVLNRATRELFVAANAAVIEWGEDAELNHQPGTVDEKLDLLMRERRALVETTVNVVEMTRSLEATTRVIADQHARVVSRFDTLELDQLDRRLSSPATALAGEFAGDDFAPVLGISAAAAAQWANLGAAMRARHPRLLALAGQGRVSVRACSIVTQELDYLDAEQVSGIEAAFLTGDAIHGGEASIRRNLRALLDHHGLARPRDEDADNARICLGFNEFPEQPTLTELNVVMPADDAWRLNTAIEHRARELAAEWVTAHGTTHGYPMRRARVDALIDLALGSIRFNPDVRITAPITLTRTAPPDPLTWAARESSTPPQTTARPDRLTATSSHSWPACPPSRPGSDSATARSITARADLRAWQIADHDAPGIGRVSAGTLRALGETIGATARVALTDDATGITAWTASQGYRPGAGIRRFVEQRDAHCRFPGCMRPAPMCDADHVIPYAEGGTTSASNLQLLCRHHHRVKTHGAWAVAMTPDGTCTWQSPTGAWLPTHPADATVHRTSAADALALIA